MSRTFKDKPWKHTTEKKERDNSVIHVKLKEYGFYRYSFEVAGSKTKKKRNFVDFWNGYYSRCPSWWTKEFMTVPKRAACRNWEKTRTLDNLEDDYPDFGNKPFIYYY